MTDLFARLWGRPALDVTLLGYPLRSTGRGEAIRATYRVLKAAGISARIFDLDQWARREVDEPEIDAALVRTITPGGIRVFSCNGNMEADLAIDMVESLRPGLFADGYNIVQPAWELPRYPLHWAASLNRYDEVWAISRFVQKALEPCISVPLHCFAYPSEPQGGQRLTRQDLGLPEDAYLVLSFLDYWSYAARKNPLAAVEAFRRTVATRPGAKLRLVMKTNHASYDPASAEVRAAVEALGDRAFLIERTMSNAEVKSLIAASDCLLSMHRSEGFGRGPAEAMFLGKPVIATGWSGNMDFMNARNSFPVRYQLIPVQPGEYIEIEDQVWADPDVDDAVRHLTALVDDTALGRRVGARARGDMRRRYGDRVIGQVLRQRLQAIAAGQPAGSK